MIYVFNNLVWPSKDVIKFEMALDRKMFPTPAVALLPITKERKALAKLLHGHCPAHPWINYNVITIADRNTTWVCALSALITDR